MFIINLIILIMILVGVIINCPKIRETRNRGRILAGKRKQNTFLGSKIYLNYAFFASLSLLLIFSSHFLISAIVIDSNLKYIYMYSPGKHYTVSNFYLFIYSYCSTRCGDIHYTHSTWRLSGNTCAAPHRLSTTTHVSTLPNASRVSP